MILWMICGCVSRDSSILHLGGLVICCTYYSLGTTLCIMMLIWFGWKIPSPISREITMCTSLMTWLLYVHCTRWHWISVNLLFQFSNACAFPSIAACFIIFILAFSPLFGTRWSLLIIRMICRLQEKKAALTFVVVWFSCVPLMEQS